MTQPTANDDNLDLPAATQGVPDSSVIMRVGVVVAFLEADNITVKISGSPVLVTASYQFPQYEPLLGDRVVVIKQDSQWFVIGTMSGPINSLLFNPSFEIGDLATLPSGWTQTNIAVAGGVPIFEKSLPSNFLSQRGLYVGSAGVVSGGAPGTSSMDVFSSTLAANPGESYVAAVTVLVAFIDENLVTFFNNGRLTSVEVFVEFLDSAAASVGSVSMANISWVLDDLHPHYLRPDPTVVADAPAGTAFVRMRMRWVFNMSANSLTQVLIDDAILRRVG